MYVMQGAAAGPQRDKQSMILQFLKKQPPGPADQICNLIQGIKSGERLKMQGRVWQTGSAMRLRLPMRPGCGRRGAVSQARGTLM